VTVDAYGDIYASDYEANEIEIFSHSGEFITQVAAATPVNVAVDGTGALYVVQYAQDVVRLTPNEFPITPATTYGLPSVFDSHSAYTLTVAPATNDVYVARSAEIAWYDEAGELLATFAGAGEPGEVYVAEGVATDDAHGTVFVSNWPSSGLSQVEVFGAESCEGPPQVRSLSAAGITAQSASLFARISPCGSETSYRFEYGTDDCAVASCMSIPAIPVSIGDGQKAILVSQEVQGLQPDTLYHYRVVAQNAADVTASIDRTFTTQGEGLEFTLSDSRAWEMVSPPNKHGAELVGATTGLVQASADGEGLAYLSVGSIEERPAGSRLLERATVLARRSSDGWHSKDLTPPNSQVYPIFVNGQGEYKLFSPDLSSALLEQRSATPLSPEASERTPYIRTERDPPLYTPLVTGKEGYANVPPGTEFGGDERPGELPGEAPVRAIGGSADLSTVVLRSPVPLIAGAPAGEPVLYRWKNGQLNPVSILPGSEGGGWTEARWFGSGPASVVNAVSEDGSRIFWSRGNYGLSGNSLTGLYVRDVVAEETARLDVQAGPFGGGQEDPVFLGANPQGTVVFFTDEQQLTAEASETGQDLYRCELSVGSAVSGCSDLRDITAPSVNPGESAEVQGVLSGMSEDASVIYFVARGVLDDQANEFGEGASPGAPNLYRWTEGAGVRFIAMLSEEDEQDWGKTPSLAATVSAAASQSGRYLSFMSERPLADSENLDTLTGERVEQGFRYDAATDRLSCVSCNPTGAAPHGRVDASGTLVDPTLAMWEGHRVAAILPDATLSQSEGPSLYRPRVVLDNCRIFFNAADGLVPADSNRQWDVYQFEPVGVGNCGPSSSGAATSRTSGGCLSLISSGTAEEEAGFLDASMSGDDIFFLTPARLNEIDEDAQLDVYDARVNGEPARRHRTFDSAAKAARPPNLPRGTPLLSAPGSMGLGTSSRVGAARRASTKLAATERRFAFVSTTKAESTESTRGGERSDEEPERQQIPRPSNSHQGAFDHEQAFCSGGIPFRHLCAVWLDCVS